MTREELFQFMEDKSRDFEIISDSIWDFSEVNYEEEKSMMIQNDYLKEQGFMTVQGAYDIKTALVAEYGSGFPIIGILGEYDALDELSQVADMTEKCMREETKRGHGCGHNLLGTAGVEAAVAIKTYLETNKLSGTIRYYGTPAEEGGAGKIYMLRRKAFDDLDICITWHPAARTAVMSECLSTFAAKFSFVGTSSHAAAAPEAGRSALDAAELMNVGVQFLREHIPSSARIHYAFHDVGGTRPNIVQGTSSLYYVARAENNIQVKNLYERIEKIAQGAALMTETTLKPVEIFNAYSNILPNAYLTQLLESEAKNVYPFEVTDEEKAYAKKYNEIIDGSTDDVDLDFHPGRASFGSTDFGDVSWIVPSIAFSGSCFSSKTPAHSWTLTAQGKSSLAHKGMHAAAKLMALVALDLFDSPEKVSEAKESFKKELGNNVYQSLLPLTAYPRNPY